MLGEKPLRIYQLPVCQPTPNKSIQLLYIWLALSSLSLCVTNQCLSSCVLTTLYQFQSPVLSSCSFLDCQVSRIHTGHHQVTLIKTWKKSRIQHFRVIIHLRQQMLRNHEPSNCCTSKYKLATCLFKGKYENPLITMNALLAT